MLSGSGSGSGGDDCDVGLDPLALAGPGPDPARSGPAAASGVVIRAGRAMAAPSRQAGPPLIRSRSEDGELGSAVTTAGTAAGPAGYSPSAWASSARPLMPSLV